MIAKKVVGNEISDNLNRDSCLDMRKYTIFIIHANPKKPSLNSLSVINFLSGMFDEGILLKMKGRESRRIKEKKDNKTINSKARRIDLNIEEDDTVDTDVICGN